MRRSIGHARFRVEDLRAEVAFVWGRARHPTRTQVWQQARHPTLSQVLIIGGVVVLSLIGVRMAMDAPSAPSVLGAAFTVHVSDAGVPYIAIDSDALGGGEGGPTQTDGGGPDGNGDSTPILLFPISDELFAFDGGDPPPGIDPPPSPNPEPSPGPGPTPSPSPGPSPSPTPGPSTTPSPAPSPEPSPTPDPSPNQDPSPTPDPSQTPEPSPTQDPSPTEDPSPTQDPSPTADPSPPEPSSDAGSAHTSTGELLSGP
jgi:hypothetical protein